MMLVVFGTAGLAGAVAQTSTGTDPGGSPSPAPLGGTSAENSVFLFTGNSAFNEGYTMFANATNADLVVASSLPSSLAEHDCVILPTNSDTFSPGQVSTLEDYLDAGGNIVANAEYALFDSESVRVMNDLLDDLGADTDLEAANLDLDFHTSSTIGEHPVTAGVGTYRYAATSEVLPSGNATGLVDSHDGGYMLAIEPIANGTVVVSGDSNDLSDNSDDAYTDHDNGVFVRNLCGGVPTALDAEPAIADLNQTEIHAPWLTATLSLNATGDPIPGQTIEFTTGGEVVCKAQTDENGTASCTDPVGYVRVLTNRSYTATFHGASFYAASNATASLVTLGPGIPPT